jgi:predicted peroxiredoxin
MATILYLGTAGSDDPTRAGLPFNFALGALDAGHQPQVFLAGEAVYLMRPTVADAVMPVAMPALKTMIDEVVAQRVPIFV